MSLRSCYGSRYNQWRCFGDRKVAAEFLRWLGRRGSNPRMTESKSVALPLGDCPILINFNKDISVKSDFPMKINFYNSLPKCGHADLFFYPTRKYKNRCFFRTAVRTCRYSGVSVLCKKHSPFFWAQRFSADSFFSDSFHVCISVSVLLIHKNHKIFWKLCLSHKFWCEPVVRAALQSVFKNPFSSYSTIDRYHEGCFFSNLFCWDGLMPAGNPQIAWLCSRSRKQCSNLWSSFAIFVPHFCNKSVRQDL